MKKTKENKSTESALHLEKLFDNARQVNELDLKGLAQAFEELDQDPTFVADSTKGVFVEDVLRALDESALSKSDLARRMGKSRQQINILLDEEKKNNFTIETMSKFSTALGRKLFVRMLATEDKVTIERASVPQPAPRPKLRDMLAQNWTAPEPKMKAATIKKIEQSLKTPEATPCKIIPFPQAA